MAQNFFILTTARSGSSWLIDTITNHPALVAHGELFNPHLNRRSNEIPEFVFSEERRRFPRPVSVWKYLDVHIAGIERAGFKLLYGQVRKFPELLPYMLARRLPAIHLVRENPLNAIISAAIVYQVLGKWALHEGDKLSRPEFRIRLDPGNLIDSLDKRIRQIEFVRNYLRYFRVPHLEVRYGNLLNGPEAFDPIWSFLGVDAPPGGPVSDHEKIQTRTHAEVIENYPEIDRVLTGTKYEGLLEK